MTAETFSALAMRVTGSALSGRFCTCLERRPVQSVPRHPGRDQYRACLRGRTGTLRRSNGYCREKPQPRHPVTLVEYRIEPEEGARPIVVFNPHSWPSSPNVELEFAQRQRSRRADRFRRLRGAVAGGLARYGRGWWPEPGVLSSDLPPVGTKCSASCRARLAPELLPASRTIPRWRTISSASRSIR